MNKTDAAAYLNISVRTLQRLTSAGEIAAGEVRGKTGMVTDYTTEELDRYKNREQDATRYVRPHVAPDAPSSHALVRASDSPSIADIGLILKSLSERLQSPGMVQPKPSLSDIAVKPLLKITEASQLTGLSYQILRAAIEDKQLKASLIGRAWRIKRTDLDAFIKRL